MLIRSTGRAPRLLGAATATFVLIVPAVQAGSESAAPIDTLDSITVFASRIGNRTVFDSAVPIDVFTSEEVSRALTSGEIGQALQSLSPSINMPRASASGTSDAMRAIQLRGLAPDQVLVLIDGKRRHTNAVMDFEGLFHGTVAVDLNSIPASAIDHIEVLRDGAGAIYGSDAIAGVVNIVLKHGTSGGSVEGSFGENHSYFAPTDSKITDGRNRLISINDGFAIGDGGWLRLGAEYQKRGATNRAGRSDAYWTSWNATDADVALNNQVVFRSGDPELENKGVFYNASLPFGANGELYSFSTLNWRSSEGAAFFRYPGDPTNVVSIHPSGFLPVSTNDSRDIGVVAGAKGVAADWHWDLSVREGYNTFSYGLTNSVNASLGDASPTSFHIANFTFDQKALNLDLTRSLTPSGWSGPINVAAGAEYMHEAYHTSPGDPASYAAGPIFQNEFGEPVPPGAQGDSGLRPQDAVQLTRHVASVYLDLDTEIAKNLLLGIAGRYSDYSDYGSSTTGKFTARYKFSDAFLVRAAVSSSFRAPALAQTGIRFATLNFNSTGDGLQNNAWVPPTDPLAQGFGGKALKPERSINSTLGLAYRLAARTSVTLDVYQVRLRDRITPTGSLYLETPAADIASVTFLTNALDTTTRGLDLVISHEAPLADGDLKLTAAFNRNYLREDNGNSAAALASGLLDGTVLVPLEGGSPSTKLILTADWSGAQWGMHTQATRYGTMYAYSYDENAVSFNGNPAQKYDPAWSVDFEAHYNATAKLTLAAGATNAFNRFPDRTLPGGTYGGAFPYNFANPLGINGAYFYVRAAYRLVH